VKVRVTGARLLEISHVLHATATSKPGIYVGVAGNALIWFDIDTVTFIDGGIEFEGEPEPECKYAPVPYPKAIP
jgi:hypothetical protein